MDETYDFIASKNWDFDNEVYQSYINVILVISSKLAAIININLWHNFGISLDR